MRDLHNKDCELRVAGFESLNTTRNPSLLGQIAGLYLTV